MSGGAGRRRGDSFADAVDGVRPIADRTKRRPEPERAPPPPPIPPRTPRFTSQGAGSARADGVSAKTLAKLARGDPAPACELDLHGLAARAAERRVREVLLAARADGMRCVRVIHGRGQRSAAGGVLRERLPEWLTTPPLVGSVLAFARDPSDRGGSTLVLLRRPERPA